MGLKTRCKSKTLPQKLKQIREKLKLSQNELLKRIGFDELFDRSTISHYESGEREPPLPVLLAYAKLANVYVDVLIDDEIELPNHLPSKGKSSGVFTKK
jgi:transcriptional regulator with XRE-family HTH domain